MSSSATSAKRSPGFLYWVFQAIPFAALYVIAVVLVAMTEADAKASMDAWLKFIPAVAAVSVILGWGNVNPSVGSHLGYLVRQALHWGGLAAIVYYVLFLPEIQQYIPNAVTGFSILCLLGLTAYLAGVHTDWRMMIFGISLLASAVGVAYLDDWSLILAGGAAATIVATLFLHRFIRRLK